MSGGPIAQQAMIDGLAAHVAASLHLDTDSADEMDGARLMASAAMDYFGTSVRGAPSGAGQTLLWAIFSSIWEGGPVGQQEIDSFFGSVRVDPGAMLSAWKALTPEERRARYSVVLVPGDLSTADISAVTAALFHARAQK